jgi:PAS domain S-box-containing protein
MTILHIIISCLIFPTDNMMTGIILTISVLTQLATAFMAVRLVKVTGNRISWGLISLSILFMAIRRSIALLEFFTGANRSQLGLPFAATGLIISALMLAGVILISPLFKSMAEEIARRKSTEEALSESEKRLSNITEHLAEGIYVFDKSGRLSFMNPEAERLLGWTIDELNEKGPHNLVHFRRPDGTPLPFDECRMHNVIMTGKGFSSTDEVFVRKDGTVFPISAITSPIVENGKITASVTVFQDITEKKRLDDQLRKSLSEKEMLLREVHHRVKNNMMVISSLLQLQSKALNEPKAAEVFRECRNRIGTMMIIYDKLYRSPDLTRVNFNEYITDLVISLFDSYNIDPDKIGVELSLSDIPIDIETAIPCGIIINELISNALKYGFPDGGSGTIKVSIRPLGNTAAELLVYNNGLEIPDTVDIHSANTFGLELVRLLAMQLGGECRLKREGGTEFSISFKTTPDR